MKKEGCVVNIDPDWLWYIYESVHADTNDFEEKIRKYVRSYANRGISDLIVCSFSQVSMTPTNVLTWLGEKYNQKIENGIEVDYTNLHRVKHIVDIYNAMDKDPYDIFVDETRKCGMTAWLALRMNDHHYQLEPTCYAHGDIYYKAKENGWFIGEESGGVGPAAFSECLDYGVEYIREKMFAYVCETLDKFDMDGLELDFQRSLYCFDFMNHPDCYIVMTEFMQRIRAYLKKTEEKRGHKIKLGVRLCRDIEQNKAFGFDVREWVKQGLVDTVNPAPTWITSDSGIPIAEWKKMLEGTGVELYAGIEYNLFFPVDQTTETYKAFVVQFFDAGADKIYPYNFFRLCLESKENPTQADVEGCDTPYSPRMLSKEKDEFLHGVWGICKDDTIARKGVRRHVMTYQENDAVPNGKAGYVLHTTWFSEDDDSPAIRKGYKPLPARIQGERVFEMQTGDCAGAETTLFLAVEKGGDIPRVEVDGAEAKCLGLTTEAYLCNPVKGVAKMLWPDWEVPTGMENSDFYAYAFQASEGNDRKIKVSGTCILNYLEIMVNNH